MDCNVTFTEANRRKNATKYCLPSVVFILYKAIRNSKLRRAKPSYFIKLLRLLGPI